MTNAELLWFVSIFAVTSHSAVTRGLPRTACGCQTMTDYHQRDGGGWGAPSLEREREAERERQRERGREREREGERERGREKGRERERERERGKEREGERGRERQREAERKRIATVWACTLCVNTSILISKIQQKNNN